MESYSEIENRMFQKYKLLTGYDCHEASDISIRIKLLAGELFNLQSSINWLNNQLFPQTAAGQQLDYHAEIRDLERKSATAAKGKLLFSIPEARTAAIDIPNGTICSTTGKDPVKFMVNHGVTIEVGKTSVEVEAFALTKGSLSNVAKGTICVINNLSVSELTVTNNAAFSGGSNEEDDESLRRRIIEDIKTPPTGTNKAYYKKLAQNIDGVYSANVVSRARGNGTVDVYIAAQGAVIDQSYVDQVQALLNQERELNVDVLVSAATIGKVPLTLTLKEKSGYDFEEVKNNVIKNIGEYFSTLQVGESVHISSVGSYIGAVEGVEHFVFTTGSTTDISTLPSQLLTVGTISIVQE